MSNNFFGLHSLSPNKGARKNKKRVGRGIGSGHGRYATRGLKGQKSRSGGTKGPGYEGGQTTLQMLTPKMKNFKPLKRSIFQVVNLTQLRNFDNEVNPEVLLKAGMIKKKNIPVKILGEGKLKKPLKIFAHKFSEQALKKIKDAGGSAEVISN